MGPESLSKGGAVGRTYRFEEPSAALPRASADGSRVIAMSLFNTDVHMHVWPSDGVDADDPGERDRLDAALIACRDRCLFFERTLSRTRPDSDIARAHAAAPEPVEVAPETCELVRIAQGYCARSGGLFDITMGTITSLWDFHAGTRPSSLSLARALPHVGYGKVRTARTGDGTCLLAMDDPFCVLDLGGVAKGYIADDLARILTQAGIVRFVLNLGGNVLVSGGHPGAAGPWRIGIADPFDRERSRAVVRLERGSVVTSGTRERCFTRGGVTYHHILDPSTGMPARTDLLSASIVADRSLDADGYSTFALMLGAQRARAYFEELDGIDAVLIDDRGEVSCTEGVASRLDILSS